MHVWIHPTNQDVCEAKYSKIMGNWYASITYFALCFLAYVAQTKLFFIADQIQKMYFNIADSSQLSLSSSNADQTGVTNNVLCFSRI